MALRTGEGNVSVNIPHVIVLSFVSPQNFATNTAGSLSLTFYGVFLQSAVVFVLLPTHPALERYNRFCFIALLLIITQFIVCNERRIITHQELRINFNMNIRLTLHGRLVIDNHVSFRANDTISIIYLLLTIITHAVTMLTPKQ